MNAQQTLICFGDSITEGMIGASYVEKLRAGLPSVRVINAGVKQEMKKILAEIQSGEFTKALIADDEAGGPQLAAYREKAASHPIEVTGGQLRPMMAWIDDSGE